MPGNPIAPFAQQCTGATMTVSKAMTVPKAMTKAITVPKAMTGNDSAKGNDSVRPCPDCVLSRWPPDVCTCLYLVPSSHIHTLCELAVGFAPKFAPRGRN
eukprot:1159384-Pelagomonas_calceolata.AAC.6